MQETIRDCFGDRTINNDMEVTSDRISDLPDPILHDILLLVPPKEAARTRVVSKRWLYICETSPVIHCYLLEEDLKRLVTPTSNLVRYVNKRIKRLREENIQVRKFQVTMNSSLAPCVDSWMEQISDMGTQHLDLYAASQPFSKNEPYRVPAKILESQSLTTLSLTRCLPNIGNLCSLVELRLESVRLDEEALQLQMILHYCPLMEVFSLLYCHHRRCELSGHPRLRSVLFTAAHGNEKFSIENVPNHEELELDGFLSDEQASFEISSSCQKLRRLKLFSILIVSNEWLQNTISPFGSLEYLELGSCSMEEDVLKLSCPRLKELVLSDCKNLLRTELDAPVLHTLRYKGDCMFRSSSIIAGKRTASLYVRRVDNSWFTGLIDFLRCNRFQELNIKLGVLRSGYGRCRSDREIYFNAEELDHPVPPPFELENLNLELITSPTLPLENGSGLLDGLLWSCRPKNITLLLTRISAAETLKELLASLVVVEQNPKCCPLSWRHFLKDVKLKYARGFDKGIPLNSSTLNSFLSYLDRCILEAKKRERHFSLRDVAKNEILCFTLSWKDNIPVPAASIIEAH